MGFYCGNGSVRDNRGEGTGFISHHKIEWRLVGDGVRAVVVSKFCMGDRFGPRCGIIAAEDMKVGLDFLVDSFRFIIGLWVIGGREGKVVM